MIGTAVNEGLALVRAGVDLLLEADLSTLTSSDVAEVITRLEVERRRREAVDVRVVAEAGDRGLAAEFCATSSADLLTQLTRVSRGEARRRVQRAIDLGPRRAVSGEPLAPIQPLTAAALLAGEISAAHVDLISRTLGAIPAAVAHEVFAVAERFLVEAAKHEDPVALRQSARLLLARVDPDGLAPSEEEQERRRRFALAGCGNGSLTPQGALTSECGAIWRTILDALARPAPAQDGERDGRSAGQRYHDALLEAGLRLLRSGTLPESGGTPVTVLIRTSEADLAKAAAGEPGGLGQTEHGELISAERLLRLAGEAELGRVVLTPLGEILDFGRTRRYASPAQRRVLAVRDGGCCFPACDRPAAWSEAHHIIAWIDGGNTDVDNLCLLCPFHHREFERRGWVVKMADGVPQWIPPAWLDPSREPRRNRAHHLPDIDFPDIDVGAVDVGG